MGKKWVFQQVILPGIASPRESDIASSYFRFERGLHKIIFTNRLHAVGYTSS